MEDQQEFERYLAHLARGWVTQTGRPVCVGIARA